jgi:hypothetical protein
VGVWSEGIAAPGRTGAGPENGVDGGERGVEFEGWNKAWLGVRAWRGLWGGGGGRASWVSHVVCQLGPGKGAWSKVSGL